MSLPKADDSALLRLAAAAGLATGALGYVATHSHAAYTADHRTRREMRRRSTPRRDRIARSISLIGEPSVQVPLSVLAGVLVSRQRGSRISDPANAAPTAAVLAAIGAHHAIKAMFPRKRPLSARLSGKTEPSYPSGHAATMTALCATTAMLATRSPRSTPALRRTVVTTAVAAPALVGLARVYSGRHWASDVVGGWTLGLAIAATARWLTDCTRRPGPRRQATSHIC